MSLTLLRGAPVITMAPNRSDDEGIDGDHIAEMGDHLDSSGAETVDLAGRIVIPGLVNAHLHTWQTGLRLAGADRTLPEYLTCVHGTLAQHYRPDDIYIGTLAGALNQTDCSTFTLADWSHNNRTPEHTDAAVPALQKSGAAIASICWAGAQ